MRFLTSFLLAVILAVSGAAAAFAAESTDDTADDLSFEIVSEEPAFDSGEDADEFACADDAEETQPAEEAETAITAEKTETNSNSTTVSSDGNYKIKTYKKGDIAFADIVKYIGKDSITTLKVSKIDGYSVRNIGAKAFKGLKKLKSVTFAGSSFGKKGVSEIKSKAFYNCPELRKLTVNSLTLTHSDSVISSGKNPLEKLVFDDVVATKYDLSAKLCYANNNGLKAVCNFNSDSSDNRTMRLSDFVNGAEFRLALNGKSVRGWSSSNPDAISVTDSGKAVVLKKGRAVLSVKSGKKTVKRTFYVETSPYLSKDGKKITSVTVDNDKTVRVRIKGKASMVSNKYDDSENAVITSDKNEDIIKIKGEKRGNGTVKVNVNGQPLSLKVKVKKNPIPEDKMARIANRIGCQVDYWYCDSTVMCSAYSYAYAYKQMTGETRSAGSFWCPGGCTWDGGTYTHYGSAKAMLKAIKNTLDKNEACVGLLSINGGSWTHYVTFYDYEGKGNKLSDFKILDPWDGSITTGANYGYSYGYHVVTVDN